MSFARRRLSTEGCQAEARVIAHEAAIYRVSGTHQLQQMSSREAVIDLSLGFIANRATVQVMTC
jgi:hypothetical protein